MEIKRIGIENKNTERFGRLKNSQYIRKTNTKTINTMTNEIEKVSTATMKIIHNEFKGLIEKYSNDDELKSMAQKDLESIESVISILSCRELLKK